MIAPFTGKTVRALVVTPAAVNRDYCRAVVGGFCVDFDPDIAPGPLWMVLRAARDHGQGLPITVHPECERRAAQ